MMYDGYQYGKWDSVELNRISCVKVNAFCVSMQHSIYDRSTSNDFHITFDDMIILLPQ